MPLDPQQSRVQPAVSTGFPSPAEQYSEEPLDLNDFLVKNPPATFFVRAAGNSMQGAGIRSGDILVVDRSIAPFDGAIVVAAIHGEFTVKYFRRDAKTIRLEPANPKFKSLVFEDGTEVRIFGVVTALIHRFLSPCSRDIP